MHNAHYSDKHVIIYTFAFQITTLQFEAGEVINIIFSGNTGWWEGEKDGARGWFPASYVTKLQVRKFVLILTLNKLIIVMWFK